MKSPARGVDEATALRSTAWALVGLLASTVFLSWLIAAGPTPRAAGPEGRATTTWSRSRSAASTSARWPRSRSA